MSRLSTANTVDPASIAVEPVGYFYTWWRHDFLPELERPASLETSELTDRDLLASISDLSRVEIEQRIGAGHRPWLAKVDAEPAGWGWSATREALIGGLEIAMKLPHDERYLWDFVTLPEWRGRHIYPALLQAIIVAETDVQRFWIGHDRENTASGRGILRAGFQRIGSVHESSVGLVYVSEVPGERSEAAAQLLGLPIAERPRA